MDKTSHYDKDTADYAVMFIESLCHTKGTWARKPFELIDWQEQIIRDIFGTLKEFKSGTLSLGVDDIGAGVASDLTGATIDANGVVISTAEDGGDPVAVGFRAKKSNGKYKYFWLYRVKFGIPATALATKGDSITFSTPTIEGTILRRNKVDGKGKHPWKAEATEGDTAITADTITNWYKQVYEPSYTAQATE